MVSSISPSYSSITMTKFSRYDRAFLLQVPPMILSIILVQWKLEVRQKSIDSARPETIQEKLRRIDFVGAVFMSFTIFTALFVLDTGGQLYPWSHPMIISLVCLSLLGGVLFFLFESFKAKEPIFPVQLLSNYVVVTSYAIIMLQNISQTAVSND